MMPAITPAVALSDPALLAPLFTGQSWATWRAVLKAAYAEPMTADELVLFRAVAGDRAPPRRRVRELLVIAGRRCGKDSIASAIAAVTATMDFSRHLRPGERASVLCLACDRDQSRIVHRYIRGIFQDVPLLRPFLAHETDNGLELTNNTEIIVATNDYRSVRGRTIAAAVFDELSYWRSEASARPDFETYNAVQPGMITLPGAILIMITTAYRKAGLAYTKWAQHFGKDEDDVLVVYGPSRAFNPGLPQEIIDREIALDPEAKSAEWLSQWRSDVSDFLDRELVENAVDRGVVVRPPQRGVRYAAFADPSGGRGDSFTLGIAHSDASRAAILDCLYERRSPFNPGEAVGEIAELLRGYRIIEVTGDAYAAGWVEESFAKNGVRYVKSDRVRSAVYLDVLPLFASGRARLLDSPRLIHQFVGLERRTSRAGRDVVDHGPNGADDLCNAGAGALVLVGGKPDTVQRWLAAYGDGPVAPVQPRPAVPADVDAPHEVVVTMGPAPFKYIN
jgi:hypothetical protein